MRVLARAAVATAAVAVFVMAGTVPATSHLARRTDDKDTRGPLDIVKASFTHKNRMVKVSQTSEHGWAPSLLRTENNALSFQFESRGKEWTDYVVYVKYDEGRLRGALYRWIPPNEPSEDVEFVSFVRVKKHGKLLRTRFPMSKLHQRKDRIGWNAESSFQNNGACREICKDYAPDDKCCFQHLL